MNYRATSEGLNKPNKKDNENGKTVTEIENKEDVDIMLTKIQLLAEQAKDLLWKR